MNLPGHEVARLLSSYGDHEFRLLMAIAALAGDDDWTPPLSRAAIGKVAGVTHGQRLAQAFQGIAGELDAVAISPFQWQYRLRCVARPSSDRPITDGSVDPNWTDRSQDVQPTSPPEAPAVVKVDPFWIDQPQVDRSTPVCMSDSESPPEPEDIQTDSAPPTTDGDPWAARRTLVLLESARVRPAGAVPTEEERRAAAKALLTRFGMARSVANETAVNHDLDYLEAHIDHYLFLLHAKRLVSGRLPGVAWLVKHLAEDYGTPAGYTPAWRWPEEAPAAAEDARDPDVTEADLAQDGPPGPAGLLPGAAWAAAVEHLRAERAETAAWLSDAAVMDVDGATFVVCVRNAYVREMVEQRCYRSLRRLLATAWGAAVEVRFVVYVPAVDGQSGEFVAAGEAAR